MFIDNGIYGNRTEKELMAFFNINSDEHKKVFEKLGIEYYSDYAELEDDYNINQFFILSTQEKNKAIHNGYVIIKHNSGNTNTIAYFLPNINSNRELSSINTQGKIAISPTLFQRIFTKTIEQSKENINLQYVIQKAEDIGASDIHFNYVSEIEVIVQFRTHKEINSKNDLKISSMAFEDFIYNKIISLANIEHTQVPNIDCSFAFQIISEGHYKEITFRVNIVNTVLNNTSGKFNKSIVIRKQKNYKDIDNLSLEKLGYSASSVSFINSLYPIESGLFLISGAVNSGKSTLLAYYLNQLHKQKKKIVSIEKPIEIPMQYEQVDLSQTENAKEEYRQTTQKVAKSLLRQDINVISFGEVRTKEEIDLFTEFGLKGALSITTQHSKNIYDVISNLSRAVENKQEYQRNIRVIIAQKLIARLCQYCKGKSDDCPSCNGTHKLGVLPIIEIILFYQNKIEVSEEIEEISKIIKTNKVKYLDPRDSLNEYYINGLILKENYKEEFKELSYQYNLDITKRINE